jgi:type II secretory pathway pseudopilin PulG
MRASSPRNTAAFTLIELLTVIAIIFVLVGLIGAVNAPEMAARRATEARLAAIQNALTQHWVENAGYPQGTATDTFDPGTSFNPGTYGAVNLELYKALSGDEDLDRQTDPGRKSYYKFRSSELLPANGTGAVTAFIDAFGNPYGYSTAANRQIADGAASPTIGHNVTYDLWSTAGARTSGDAGKWIKNW